MIDRFTANRIRHHVLTKVNRNLALFQLTTRSGLSGLEANELLDNDSWSPAQAELVHRALLLPLHLTGIFGPKVTVTYPETFLHPGPPRPEPSHIVVRQEPKPVGMWWQQHDDQYQVEGAERPPECDDARTIAVRSGVL